MEPMNRRDFLKNTLLGLGALTINELMMGCTPGAVSAEVKTTVVDSPAATQTAPANAFSGPHLAVARGGNDPEILVRKAIAAIGGMQRFVPKGAAVLIKPNMCVPRPFEIGATTNPLVVGALVKMCFEAGAKKVKVLDYPFGGPSDVVYETCGVAEQVRKAGGEMEVISNIKFVKTSIPDAKRLKETDIYDEVFKSDVLINVPVAKNHSLAKYTIGMKNLLGLIRVRGVMHNAFADTIPDLNSKIRPALTVVDAIRIMLENGPTGGSPDYLKKTDTVIVSPDIVAADSYALGLFGEKPENIDYISRAAQRGLGSMSLKDLKIEEIYAG